MTEYIPDEIPEVDNTRYCGAPDCGVPLPEHTGRGRKPTRCEEHRKRSGVKRVASTTSNTKLAGDAVEVLSQINSLLTAGMFVTGFPESASALASTDETFRAQAHAALLTDPDLCRVIVRGGGLSGKVMLAFAYGGMLMSAAPVMLTEWREKRAAKQAAYDEMEHAAA